MSNKKPLLISVISILFLILLLVWVHHADNAPAGTSIDDAHYTPTQTTVAETVAPTMPSKDKLVCQYNKLSDTATNREDLEIYIPCQAGYCKVVFRHSVSQESNYDIWHMNQMIAVDETLVSRYDITNTGEFEAAIRLLDRDDFSGGSNHGDEIVSAIHCYIDNTATEFSQLSALTTFDEMKITRSSTLYDPADHTTPIAEHNVDYIFSLAGVTVSQRVHWLVNETCHTSYLAMFPVLRSTTAADGSTVHVSEYYTDSSSDEAYDVLAAGKSEYPQTWKQGVAKMTLLSDSLGLEATLSLTQYSQIPGAGYSQCSSAEQYNKLYFSITGFGSGTNYQVVENDVWEATSHYAVNITK